MLKLFLLNIALTIALIAVAPASQAIARDYIPTYHNVAPTFIFNDDNIYTDYIRIGLESRYLNSWQVGLGNTALIIGIDHNGFAPVANITGTNFTVVADANYYMNTNRFYGDFISALNTASLYHNGIVNVDVNYSGFWFTVAIGPFTSANEAFTAHPNYTLVSPSTTRVRLIDHGRNVITSQVPLQFIDATGDFMHLGGRSYRGVIETGRHTGSGITPVNIIDIEEYLFSVVPSEMPASWHIEALKAQTIAARSYTHTRRGSHSHLGYELCDTVFSQVYSGVDMEHENSTLAVQLTRGLMAFHGDDVILAVYFSSSGGHTENSENAWLETVPYLRAVPDPHEVGAMEWNRTFTMTEINRFATAANINVGHIGSISVTHSPHGRVYNLILNGSNGTHAIRGEAIRTFFQPSTDGSLHSRNFTMIGTQTALDNTVTSTPGHTSSVVTARSATTVTSGEASSFFAIGAGGQIAQLPNNVAITGDIAPTPPVSITQSQGYTVAFTGRGWGHGVGMSQFGANSMAELGFNHVQILQHYFRGTQVRSFNNQ